MSLARAAAAELRSWTAPSPEQDALRQQYLRHLDAHADAVWRSGPPDHLTASCMVFDPTGRQVALTLHRKGGFWVQFGGHCEPGDADLAATALREAREESGLDLRLLPGPVDLDRHPLPRAFGRCREHLDVAYAAVADPAQQPAASAESLDVAWWPLDGLPAGIIDDLPPRLDRAAGIAAANRSAAP